MLLHPDGSEEVRRLFHEQVPELADGVIEIKAIARERGQRTMVAVCSNDSKVDPVSACVGQQGSRVKPVAPQLPGERVDIIRWSESAEHFIVNALAPMVIRRITLDATSRRATISVDPKRLGAQTIDPVRMRLASKLVGWELQLVET